MKRFILKSMLLIFIAGGILFLANFAYMHTDTYHNMEKLEGTDTYASMPDTIDVAVFGASHGEYAFRIAPDGDDFFNFSLSGQSPQYDLMLMREYQDRIRPGALVILTMSYTSLFWKSQESDFEAKQPRYYRILSLENIIDPDVTKYYLVRYCPLLAENITSLIASFASLFLNETSLDGLNEYASLSEDQIPGLQMLRHRKHWDAQIAPIFPDTNPDMVDTYRQMLDICREHGWNAILVTPPYLPEYSDCFPDEFFPVFYDAVDQLRQEYGVPYLDYSHDGAYAGQYSLFKDIDHMNLAGAEVFDAQFYADLAAQGIWPVTSS